MRRVLMLLLLLLALPAAAHAGGYATVGLSSTPAGTQPGEPWKVELQILQHGITPLEDVKPAVIVTDTAGRDTRFAASPTGRPGVYRAEVTFPEAGRYTYTVDDGFAGAVHKYAPVTIEPAASVPAAPVRADDDGFPWLVPILALGAVALTLTLHRHGRRLAT